MNLKEVSKQLDELYSTCDSCNSTIICSGIFFDGEEIGFRFYLEEEKYACIETLPNFAERVAWCTGDWKKATPVICKLVKNYDVEWDDERGVLFIRFRRNEMTMVQAVLRLTQATLITGSLGEIIKII